MWGQKALSLRDNDEKRKNTYFKRKRTIIHKTADFCEI
jgi:hypothetical protein